MSMRKPEFIFTVQGAKGNQQMTAHKRPIPHTNMDRWVRCYLVGDQLVVPGDPLRPDPHGDRFEPSQET